MVKSILVSFFTLLVIVGFAQNKEYSWEFTSIKLLENPAVNSYAEEIYPLYDRSYDTLFLVRSHHNDNIGRDKVNQDIWYCYKKDNTWSDPINFKSLNNAENNSIVGLSNNKERLYLLNSYTSNLVRNRGIVYTDYEDGSWTKPLTIDFEVNTGNNLYSFFINHLEDVILITMFNEKSEGDEDLFVSLKGDGGHWREPIYMGHTINSEGFETSPFLTDDKKTVFFSSNGFGGYGDADIFMSQRLDDSWSSWSEPVNLGSDVNSDKFDGYFSIYENGEFLFGSNRDSKFSDIFTGKWTKTEVKVTPKTVEQKVAVDPLPVATKNVLPSNYEVYFDSNSSYFDKKKYAEQLKATASYLSANPNVALVVEGHADKVGDEMYNLMLSLKRAKSIADYIKSQGSDISDDRIMTVPSGESKSNEDHDASRRVSAKYILLN